jgi:flagellar basal-body rod protein FlgB
VQARTPIFQTAPQEGRTRVSALYIDQLSSQRTQWLDLRQSLIASNVSNANTPGFAAKDLPAFSTVLAQTQVAMTATDPMHITPTPADYAPPQAADEDGANSTLSGNSVNIEGEMMKLGEIGRDANTVNAIKKIYHQMMLSVLK